MGCLQSVKQKYKPQKQKQKPKPITLIYGSNNQKWKHQLQIDNLNFTLITTSTSIAQHPVFLQIQKDITRTFPNQKYFQSLQNVQYFRQTLKCFALSFPKIGYTQGLNFLAGYLLLNNLSIKQTLSIMSSLFITPSMLIIGLYEDFFPLTYFYCDLFWAMLEKIDKELYIWLKEINIPDQMWIFQWFITFFIYSFPIQYIGEFFNYIFEKKIFAMVQLAVAIILVMKQNIINLEHQEYSFVQFIESIKNIQKCQQLLKIDQIFKKTQLIQANIIKQCLKQFKQKKQINNFYIKYFTSNQQQQKILYQMFLNQLQNQNLQVSQSKDTNLLQSYKRNSNNVLILDQILQASIKRQFNSRNSKQKSQFRSNMGPVIAQSKIFTKSTLKKPWKSQAFFQNNANSFIIKQEQTNFSIVKNIDVNNSKICIFDSNVLNSQSKYQQSPNKM